MSYHTSVILVLFYQVLTMEIQIKDGVDGKNNSNQFHKFISEILINMDTAGSRVSSPKHLT